MLFEKVLNMSLIGCFCIAVVLVIRLLLSKCERKYSFALWFVVFLNLCLPISIQGPFSLIPDRIAEGMVVQEPGYYGEVISDAEWQQYAENGQLGAANSTAGESVDVKDAANPAVENDTVMNSTAGISTVDKEQLYWEYVGTLNGGSEAVPEADEAVSGVVAGELDATAGDAAQSATQPQLPATQSRPATSAGEINIPLTVACFVWLLGVAVIWVISLYKGIRLSRKLKKSRAGQEISAEGVVCAKDISAPFLWGVFKPVIYLPADIGEEERTYIVAHESYHRKRFDHISKLVVFGIVTIHWFNPLVWLAYALFVRDMEISCDEAVLAHTGQDIKKQYASSLLKYAAKQNGFVLAPLTFGEPSLKSRIKNVLRYKKGGMVVTIVAGCVVALTACGLVMRPQSEEQSGNQVVQGSEAQETPTAAPASTAAPEATETPSEASPYSVYFQDILQANYEEKDGKYQKITEVGSGAKFSYVENVTEYQEPQIGYHSPTFDFYLERGGMIHIDWLKLSNDNILENLNFDMSTYMKESGFYHVALHDLFYDKDLEQVYVVICTMGSNIDAEAGRTDKTWLVSFASQTPEDYEIYTFEYSSWFGECYKVDNLIFLHGGSGDTPYVIDVETMEGRLCTAEHTAAQAATYEMAVKDMKEQDRLLHICWMKALGTYEDVELYSGLLMEAMDFFPGIADVYVASRDGVVLETMVVEKETGEVIIVEGMETNPAIQPMKQSEIDWFNESFFNQGYLQEGEAALEGIRNQFLTHEYARPEDIDISEVFYNGAGEELTENDRICLSGEERWKLPLYTGDMVLLSEEEHAAVAEIDVDVSRVSWDTMDTIMTANTGLTVWETNRVGMESLYFNKHDGVFYHFHGDTNALFVQVRSGHYNADGTITLYYVRSGSEKWINEATEEFAVVLRPDNRRYWFVSNRKLEGSSLSETLQAQQEQKQQQAVTEDYPAYWKEVLNFHKGQASSSEYVVFENENSLWKNTEGKEQLPLEILASEGYSYQVDSLELGNGTVLKNLTFDFQEKMQEADCERLVSYGAHYDESEKMIYLLFNMFREEGGILLLAFGEETPEEYQLTIYEGIDAPMGGSFLLGNSIFLDAGIPENIPWKLNLETGEMVSCEQEYEEAMYLSQRYCAQYRLKSGISLELWWFHALGYVEDVEIYVGYLEEEENFTTATIYTAYREDTCLGALVIDNHTGEIYFSTEQQEETSPYKLTAVSHEDYNAVFDNNGYQYYFKLDMDTANLFLLFGEKVERSNSTGKWTVTPVYASNGAKEELLGEIRGFVFDVTSDALVGPNNAVGNKFCGKISAVTESSVELYQAEALDMDTYTEFVNVSETAETYPFAEDVEFVMLDANFRNVSTTYERFTEHAGRGGETFYYFVEKDGEIVQIWQPFIP